MASTSRKRKEIKRQEIRRQDDKRQAIVAARSKFAASERTRLHMGKKGAALPSPTWFYIAGVTLVLCGVVELAWLCAIGLEGKSFDQLPRLSGNFSYMGAPGVLFLLAGIPLFLAEMFRRSRLSIRARSFWQGGSVAIVIRETSLVVNLVWLLVPVAAYIALVVVPLAGAGSASGFGAVVRGASDDFWGIVTFYGFLAAGIVGVFLASLLKRATYERFSESFGPPGNKGRTLWRLVSTQWRGESWFSFTSAGTFGVLPFLWHDALAGQKHFDNSALAIMVGIGASCGVLAVVTVLNAWRSGEPYGLAESVA